MCLLQFYFKHCYYKRLCLSVHGCVLQACEGQKSVLEFLELELHVVVSHVAQAMRIRLRSPSRAENAFKSCIFVQHVNMPRFVLSHFLSVLYASILCVRL